MPTSTSTEDLTRVSMLTTEMRDAEQRLAALGRERRGEIRRLRLSGITWRSIAQAAGVTEQALYADLRKHPDSRHPE